jgi:indolepyruvate ferredoxin oxidoreductase alpha subunit
MDMVYNNAPATLLILDNSITAMTGRQDNPASGFTLMDQPACKIDIPQLCRALGARNVRTIDPYDLEESRKALEEEMERPEPSVIVTNRPCVLVKREDVFKKSPVLSIDQDTCTGCRACLKIGCPAIIWEQSAGNEGKAYIDTLLCTGCDVCRQLCKFNSIRRSH